MGKLDSLEPKAVFKYFEQLSAIPRGSGNMSAISDFCCSFAQSHSLRYVRQENGNVIIYKPASADCENCETVIIQGHLDMVCEKDPDCDIDMDKQGLRLMTDGEFVFADGTTLGGDDGIAIAYALAVLDDRELKHPPLEVVLTVDEETGMFGAAGLDATLLSGRRLINIDSDDEGIFTVSCAGGVRAAASLRIETKDCAKKTWSITVDRLCGGHSGTEINKGRANANKIIISLIAYLSDMIDLRLISIDGGLKDNAIPRAAGAVFASDCDENTLLQAVRDYEQSFRLVFPDEKEAVFGIEMIQPQNKAMTEASTKRVISWLKAVPDGVVGLCTDGDAVETSLNMGVLSSDSGCVRFDSALRSSVDAKKKRLMQSLSEICAEYDASVSFHSEYPAWEYRKDSELREAMVSAYSRLFGKKPEILSIHAGLECGIFCGKIPGLDCISFGPQNYDIHTTRERLSIGSVERMWLLLRETLASLCGQL